ncbi:uncharacterized protein [Arachis hypogaea]|uniref:Uncharacterized protein n=2 Tax=Arachis TaxID=3817 RepID=A0A445CH79_ARAHY|nr:uncharacterized serine-rich protein C215.13 [Arachis hypogaea]QHO28825.1 uncharacterized protein DS421_7g220010 [Arachis hypogaea]RYR50283.1 hypothetical protein Ahy_A07g036889 isoform C [Arachis hypogaea]
MVCLLDSATNHGTLTIQSSHQQLHHSPPISIFSHSLTYTTANTVLHFTHSHCACTATPTCINHTVATPTVHDPRHTMASACVNNMGLVPPPENFSYGSWLSPRLSFSKEEPSGSKSSDPIHDPDPEPDFEFRGLDGPPAAMLSADQLFSDGKLVPLNLPSLNSTTTTNHKNNPSSSPETTNLRRRLDSSSYSAAGDSLTGADPYLFSPKAPRCSSRWRELLGLKKLYQSTTVSSKATTSSSSSSSSSKSLKLFLHRGAASKPTSFSSENAPLLTKDHSDCESLSISSSRLSLSSSSSGHEHEELPRLSLDSEKPNPNTNPNPISLHRNPNHPRIRLVKPRANSFDAKPGSSDPHTTNRVGRSPIRRSESGPGACSRGVSVDSPRMNSSGKIVFQSLERSSSSPSSFNNGGPRFKQRGMERSYSSNVRVTPVLNVPVCSLRGSSKSGSVFGFGQLFGSPQKKEGGSVGNNNVGGGSKGRNRCDRN